MKITKRKRLLIGFGVVAVGGLSLWGYLRAQDQTQYQTAALRIGSITATISATGTCNAVTTVQVGSQVSGNIKELYADFNTKVKKGQLVARIDPESFQARVNQAQAGVQAAKAAVLNAQVTLEKSQAGIDAAKANLKDAQANVSKAQVDVQDAKIKWDRALKLFQDQVIAKQDRDSAQFAYDSSVAALDAANAQAQAAQQNLREAEEQRDLAQAGLVASQAQLEQAQATLRQAQVDLDHTYIRAPVDGVVISRNVDVGQTVAASLQAPTLFLIAQDLTKMQIDTSVDEADIGKVRVGQTASFTVDAYPAQNFDGKVVEIREAPIEVQNVVTYDVIIAVANPQLKLFPGMTANVNIIVERHDHVLKIPEAALRFQPPESTSSAGQVQAFVGRRQSALEDSVWVLAQNGNPQRVPVQLGISDGRFAELIKGDLKPGQDVIVGTIGKAAGNSGSARRRGFHF
jgi:HlyD family secretion protein